MSFWRALLKLKNLVLFSKTKRFFEFSMFKGDVHLILDPVLVN